LTDNCIIPRHTQAAIENMTFVSKIMLLIVEECTTNNILS